MYHPIDICGDQVLIEYDFSLMTTLYTGGSNGVLLKLNVPSSAVYSEILGFCLDCLNHFNINLNCLIRQQNKCIRKF